MIEIKNISCGWINMTIGYGEEKLDLSFSYIDGVLEKFLSIINKYRDDNSYGKLIGEMFDCEEDYVQISIHEITAIITDVNDCGYCKSLHLYAGEFIEELVRIIKKYKTEFIEFGMTGFEEKEEYRERFQRLSSQIDLL